MCSAKKRSLEKRRRDELVQCRNDANTFWQKLKTFKSTVSNCHSHNNAYISSDTWVAYFHGLLYRDTDEV